MFDITPNDIVQLTDTDLRELVGRLCEADLAICGLSPAAVTWRGNQTAADGGLDVRVALPTGAQIEGFVPRPSTGFQVKKPDMPRSEIIAEMRPGGAIRTVIQELANEAGAYVIVSSTGSTADSALNNRRNALREALNGVTNAANLHTDFYDRTRLATWVRRHPGLITWVKERVGGALVGWHPYGSWSGGSECPDAEYLLDDKLRLRFGNRADASAQSAVDAIDLLRNELAQPRTIVRLVGLSGVGKTRFAQALFDSRIGTHSLPPSLAVYTNLSDNPDPQPIGLATELIANGTRAILIVDNCPPDLHRRLSDSCRGPASALSILTVEYDVRDDQPEGTQVVTLDTSSLELIEKLVHRRYQHLSQVDAHSIAEASGGNARIAIALAETVGISDTIAGLSNDELFQRLFRQRQDQNDGLLLTAQACSLVYSFEGEMLQGSEAELPCLAELAGQTAAQAYRYVGELIRRDLVQKRGVWRAVLPHAVANRLAARALEDTPQGLIEQKLVDVGNRRLAQSFSRRLSFLHDSPKALAIVQQWLSPEGLLGDVSSLDNVGQAMFDNVAPVLPEATLAALERIGSRNADIAPTMWRRHRSVLSSLAYDPAMFERSATMLAIAATQNHGDAVTDEMSGPFVSLFTLFLSGTHATIEQRLGVLERLVKSGEATVRALGLAGLANVLEATNFSSEHSFDFGARSRNHGYEPKNQADVVHWYSSALSFVERLALKEGLLKLELRDLLARSFRGLWTSAEMHIELDRLCRMFAADGFWRDGWAACRLTMQFDHEEFSLEVESRLSNLEAALHPSSLPERVRAFVLGDWSSTLVVDEADNDGGSTSSRERLDDLARELGAAVARDDAAFAELLPDLPYGGIRIYAFGWGLANDSPDPRATWSSLIQGMEEIDQKLRNAMILRGYLSGLSNKDKHLTQQLLDSVLDHAALRIFLPELQSAAGLDESGVERLMQALSSGQVPIGMYGYLAHGRTTDGLAGRVLKDLLLLIANQPNGVDVAVEILSMRMYSDRSANRHYEPELVETGRKLVHCVEFRAGNRGRDHNLARIVRACLADPDAAPIAGEVATKLRNSVAARETSLSDNLDLLKALLQVQPLVVLDVLLGDAMSGWRSGAGILDRSISRRGNPADVVSCDALIAWCERDREHRYPLAASIITFARRPESSRPLIWSEQANKLLANAPDPRSVLEVFMKRFRPLSWSGSRASLIEANARLLDSLDSSLVPGLMTFVTEAKAQLAQDVQREMRWETQEARVQDERFE